jgi:cysteine synthase A
VNQIGHTPLLKLDRLAEPGCAEIYVKYEAGNPTGSMKDRMVNSLTNCPDNFNWLNFI